MAYRKLLIALLASLCITACHQRKITSENHSDDKEIVGLSRGSCKGTCPVYHITIMESGRMVYNGIKNVETTGNKTIKLPEEAYKELIKSFEVSNFDELEDNYTSNIRDLPKMVISYGDKEITYHKGKAPKILIELASRVDELAFQNLESSTDHH